MVLWDPSYTSTVFLDKVERSSIIDIYVEHIRETLDHTDLGDDDESEPCGTQEQFNMGMVKEAQDEAQEVDVSIEGLADASVGVVGKRSYFVTLMKIILKMKIGILKMKGMLLMVKVLERRSQESCICYYAGSGDYEVADRGGRVTVNVINKICD